MQIVSQVHHSVNGIQADPLLRSFLPVLLRLLLPVSFRGWLLPLPLLRPLSCIAVPPCCCLSAEPGCGYDVTIGPR